MNIDDKMKDTFRRFMTRRLKGYSNPTDNERCFLVSEYSASTMIPLVLLYKWCSEFGVIEDKFVNIKIKSLSDFYGN